MCLCRKSSEAYIVEFGFLNRDQFLKSHLRLFQNTQNKFIMHFDAFLDLFFRLKNGHFGDFSHFLGQNHCQKNDPKVKHAPIREVFREPYIVEFWFLNHDQGMKSHLRLFRNTKNKFIMHFDAFFILIFSLEKWAFLRFSPFFQQKLPKIKIAHFSSA